MSITNISLSTLTLADTPFERICQIAQQTGYDGLELGVQPGQLDLVAAANDRAYAEQFCEKLDGYGLKITALATHLFGKFVAEKIDARHDSMLPEQYRGKPESARAWAKDQMLMVPTAMKNLHTQIATGFMGSTIWDYLYMWPGATEEVIQGGFSYVAEQWRPILKEFERQDCRFALEVDPTEIAFDYYTTERLLRELEDCPAFGINLDPSHLYWQRVNPVFFARDFASKIYNVHLKDAVVVEDGRAGVLGSYLPFGDWRRGWHHRAPGYGAIDFKELVRTLNEVGYCGPAAVELEDPALSLERGARDGLRFAREAVF